MGAFFTKIFGFVTGWLDKYIVIIRWVVLIGSWVAIAWAVHHVDGLSVKAAQTDHAEAIAQSVPQVVTVTQTITKVIHDSKDKCAGSAIPAAVLDQLH